jgi:hypothetical protein
MPLRSRYPGGMDGVTADPDRPRGSAATCAPATLRDEMLEWPSWAVAGRGRAGSFTDTAWCQAFAQDGPDTHAVSAPSSRYRWLPIWSLAMRIGYGRVSTRDQDPGAQLDALTAAGAGRAAPCGIRLPGAKPRSPTPTRPQPASRRGRHGKISDQGRQIAAPRALHGAAAAHGCLAANADRQQPRCAAFTSAGIHARPGPSCRKRFTIVLIGPGSEDQGTQRPTERAESASLRQVINSIGVTRSRSWPTGSIRLPPSPGAYGTVRAGPRARRALALISSGVTVPLTSSPGMSTRVPPWGEMHNRHVGPSASRGPGFVLGEGIPEDHQRGSRSRRRLPDRWPSALGGRGVRRARHVQALRLGPAQQFLNGTVAAQRAVLHPQLE